MAESFRLWRGRRRTARQLRKRQPSQLKNAAATYAQSFREISNRQGDRPAPQGRADRCCLHLGLLDRILSGREPTRKFLISRSMQPVPFELFSWELQG